jgi:hypothetical protein
MTGGELPHDAAREPEPEQAATLDAIGAVANAHRFFEENSGWAPPDDETLAEWVADGVCRCPDECLVEPQAWCEHGLASWWLVLGALEDVEVPELGRAAAPWDASPSP